ncbi:uncharacterized protein [Ambystoma mexicanum]|uniref:uncharacterized protein n=1 Tax=Ambystoma mexicanum TaxID=8296 RepID=UPI0037E99E6E
MAGLSRWGKYGKRYCKDWEKSAELKDWIRPVHGDHTKAACRFCKSEVRAHHADLMQHKNTEKHRKNCTSFSSARLTDMGFSAAPKLSDASLLKAELQTACLAARHTTIIPVDHVGELVASSHYKDIKRRQARWTALINRVLSPCMLEALIKDIGSTPYSLLIEESTDIPTLKQLCVVVRYFSQSLNKIIATFLGLVTPEGETSEAIANSLLQFLENLGLEFTSCLGIGTDGCSVMVGKHNSVYTRLRQQNERLILIKCVCHSLQRCASKAVLMLPCNLEFLVGSTYSWFSCSAQRQREYAKIYALINTGEDLSQLVQLSDTRWLSIYDCCVRVLQHWDALKRHFQLSMDKEWCYEAELL